MWYTVAVSKKRKTKEQKIITELRRKISLTEVDLKEKKEAPQVLHSFQLSNTSSASAPVKNDYSYVLGDLKRVSFLIGLAILAQGVLYLLLRA